ncbi:MAG: choice-of-anchor D domain-containing protein, partial [bacterium]|nr:choice-of-anchor D domain-containing protein [bacterium]
MKKRWFRQAGLVVLLALMCFAFAAGAEAEVQKAMFPLNGTTTISQGYGTGMYSHIPAGCRAIDLLPDNYNTSSEEWLFAPFDLEVKYILASAGNSVVVQSQEKVLWADGTTDYVTMLLCHMDNISHLNVGKTYRQGEIFYQAGDTGISGGRHIHLECAKGEWKGGPWYNFMLEGGYMQHYSGETVLQTDYLKDAVSPDKVFVLQPNQKIEYTISDDYDKAFSESMKWITGSVGPNELIATSSGNGKAELSTDGVNWVTSLTVEAGARVLVKATADSGYSFSHWTTSNGSDASFGQTTAYQTVFTMPSGNTTVTAHFTAPGAKYQLNVSAGNGGTVNAASGQYAAGTSIALNATASNGYVFSGWTSSSGGTFANTNSASTSFVMPANATNVTANFKAVAVSEWKPGDMTELYAPVSGWPQVSATNPIIRGWLTCDPSTRCTYGGLILAESEWGIEHSSSTSVNGSGGIWRQQDAAVEDNDTDTTTRRYNFYYTITDTPTTGLGRAALEPGHTYYWKFYAIMADGTVVYSPVKSYKVPGEQPVYSITANPASLSFGSQIAGYTAPAAQTVTITNTGNQTVTLTQPIASSYTIGALSTTSLAPNGTATFTVTPKAGLSAGTYNESIVINTNSTASANVSASFTVAEAVYSIAVSPNVLDFGTITEGEQPVGKTVAITNTGNQTVTLNTQSQPAHYTLSNYSKATLQPGETATVVVTPKSGLSDGSYDGSFWITTDAMPAS